MKKILAILMSAVMLVSLLAVGVSAETELVISNGVALIGAINNPSESAQLAVADPATGAFTIEGLAGWQANVAYMNSEIANFAVAEGESLYVSYDITVPAGGTLQIMLNGWGTPIGGLIAGAAAQPNDEGNPVIIPAGTYKGYFPITKEEIGAVGKFGTVGSGAIVRELRVVSAVEQEVTGGGEGGEGGEGEGDDVITGPSVTVGDTVYGYDGEWDLGMEVSYNADPSLGYDPFISESVNGLAANFTGKQIYLYYDFTTVGGTVNIGLNVVDNPVVMFSDLIGAKDVPGFVAGSNLPVGSYKGMIKLDALCDVQVNLGTVGYYGDKGWKEGLVCNAFKLLSVTGTAAAPSEDEIDYDNLITEAPEDLGAELPQMDMLGASVRGETDIRFGIELNVKDWGVDLDAVDEVRYGTLFLPTETLGENELTLATADVLDVPTAKWQENLPGYEDRVLYTGVLCGIPSADEEITARGYMLYSVGGEWYVLYSAQISRSINGVRAAIEG